MRKITKFRRSAKAVSPVIAVLLMIVIAVAAALFAYSWVMGYLDFLTIKTDQGVQVQAINWKGGTSIEAYVMNTGPAAVELANVYINDKLDPDAEILETDGVTENKTVGPSETRLITSEKYDGSPQVTVKVVTADGNIFMLKKTVTSTTGGGPHPAVLYRKPITITGVEGGPHPNFPVLVSITGDNEIGGVTGDSGGSPDGDHIYFSDGTTKLAHEIESWTGGDGSPVSLVAWVKVPSLTNNKVIYIYYGSDIAGGQENPTGVWDSNYKGVWHLKETGTGAADEYKDSTSNNNHGQGGSGAKTPSQTTGKVNGAQDFTRTSGDFINIENDPSLDITSTITLEAWIKIDSVSGWNMIVSRQYGTDNGDGYLLGVNSGRQAAFIIRGNPVTYSSALSTGQYYHVVGTGTTGTNNLKLYINGNQVDQDNGVAWTLDDNPVIIGAGENDDPGTDPNELFDGVIDEARISNTVRSADWIKTEYENINAPATISGAEEEV